MSEMKYLKKGSVVLPVVECYAYRYDYGKGKTVLRVKVDASDATFAEVQEFFGEVSDFEQWDEGMENLETVYTDYGADLDIHYKKPTDEIQPDGSVQTQSAFYEVEVLRDPSIEAAMRSLYKENASLKAADQEKEQRISELTEEVNRLKSEAEETGARIDDLEAENAENIEIQAELLYELCLAKIEKEVEEDGVQNIEEID